LFCTAPGTWAWDMDGPARSLLLTYCAWILQ